MDAEGGEFGFGFQVVIESLVVTAALPSAAEIAYRDAGLGVDGQADGSGIGIGLGVNFVNLVEDGIGFGNFPQRLGFGNAAGLEAEVAHHPAEAAFGREFLLGVAFRDKQAVGFRSGETTVEPGGAEGGIGLTVGFADGTQIVPEPGEFRCEPLAPAKVKAVSMSRSGVEFLRTLAQCRGIPTEFAPGPCGTATPQSFNHRCHENPSRLATELTEGLLPDFLRFRRDFELHAT